MFAPASRAPLERRRPRPTPVSSALSATGVAAVIFVTLCPIGLRPHLGGADAERFVTFLALGFLFSRVAGRRGLSATAAVVGLAVGLELAQRFAPGRHAHLADALVKALGGVAGVAAEQIGYPLRRRLERLGRPRRRAGVTGPALRKA